MVRKNSLEMYSTHNEGKSVVAKIFIRTLQNRIYKYMTLISKNVYIDKLDAVVKKMQQYISQLNWIENCWCKIKQVYWL